MPYADPQKHVDRQRERVADNRAEYLATHPCAVCGTADNLQVDHIDPSQKISHRIWSWARERREAELAKCQVLCLPHHWEKTRQDMGWGMVHGTAKGYRYYRCRCLLCTRANNDAVNEYRWRTGKRKKRH